MAGNETIHVYERREAERLLHDAATRRSQLSLRLAAAQERLAELEERATMLADLEVRLGAMVLGCRDEIARRRGGAGAEAAAVLAAASSSAADMRARAEEAATALRTAIAAASAAPVAPAALPTANDADLTLRITTPVTAEPVARRVPLGPLSPAPARRPIGLAW